MIHGNRPSPVDEWLSVRDPHWIAFWCLAVFAIGLPWLAITLHLNLSQTLAAGFYPFLIGGLIKAVIAAGLLPLAWLGADKLAKRRDAE